MDVLGSNIKRLRKAQGLTQADLAERANLPRASLANMEKPHTNPGIHSVMAVAAALNVGVEELLTPAPEQRIFFVGPQDAQEYQAPDGGFTSRQVSPIASRGVQVQVVHMQPKCESVGRPHPKGSQEYFYCWSGTARIRIDGEDVDIPAGSLVQFPGHLKHIYMNPSEQQPVAALSVVVLHQV